MTHRRSALATVLAIAAMVAGLGCGSEAGNGLTTSDEAALRQALDTEMKAARTADGLLWASLYTPDAIVLRPHGPAVEGRDAIQQWLATLPPISKAVGEAIEATGFGDLAYLRGRYTMSFSIPGVPAPIEEQGKFIQVYRRQDDGAWKMTREIYNSDLPLPTPPPPAASQQQLRESP